VVDLEVAFSHQFFKVAEAERKPKIPANAQNDDLGFEMPPFEQRRFQLRHELPRLPNASTAFATHPDFVIPLNEHHLKMTVQQWGNHYNRGRPHSTLGPGLPEPTQDKVPASGHRHKLPAGFRIAKTSVLGGLHHEYRLVKEAA
jgi:hypothetical protein